MIHGDAVADADDRKLERCPPSHTDAVFYRPGKPVQVNMPGHDLVVSIDDADKWAVQLFIGITHRFEEGAVGGFLHTFFYPVTAHLHHLLFHLNPQPRKK